MIVPIFPLPDTVFFPMTRLPLRVFEDRYRRLTRAALAGDRRIVIALLQEGWETDALGNPPVHRVACLGEIAACRKQKGGRYDLVLAGRHRVRIVRELEHSPYRLAEVERIDESRCDDASTGIIRRRNRLMGLFLRYAELAARGRSRAHELVPRRSFEALVNLAAAALNVPPEDKQQLLEIDDIVMRCDAVLPVLQRHVETLVLVRDWEHLKPEEPTRN